MTNIDLSKKLAALDLENVLLISIKDEEPTKEEKEDMYSVSISKKTYFENKELVDDFVRKLCSYERTWIRTLYFDSKYHMTEEYFKILQKNSSLASIILNDYALTKKDFDILKENQNIKKIETSIISEELNTCYDKRLTQVMKREITNCLDVEKIIYEKELNIPGPLTEEQALEICNLLEHRAEKGKINFSDFTDSISIKRIIDKLNILEKDEEEKTKITISIEDRHNFNYEPFSDKNQNSTIEVLTDTDEPTDLNIFIKVEEKMKELIAPIEKHKDELSPFEILIWLYTIVSTYRRYKREGTDEDYRISRFLNKLLFADKLVCVGYSFLLSDSAKRFSIDTWENYACDKSDTRKDGEYNHLNNLVFLKDKKYDINGVYLMDTTFDNHEDKELFVFNHFLLTPEKYSKHLQKIYAAGYSLLTLRDKDEFLRIIQSDRIALTSIVNIILKYFKNDEIFRLEYSNAEDINLYYIESLDKIYELAQNINIEEIPEDKIKKALVHIEQLKNPNISLEALEEKLNQAFDLFHKRDEKIYGPKDNTVKKNTLQ